MPLDNHVKQFVLKKQIGQKIYVWIMISSEISFAYIIQTMQRVYWNVILSLWRRIEHSNIRFGEIRSIYLSIWNVKPFCFGFRTFLSQCLHIQIKSNPFELLLWKLFSITFSKSIKLVHVKIVKVKRRLGVVTRLDETDDKSHIRIWILSAWSFPPHISIILVQFFWRLPIVISFLQNCR